MTAQLARIVAGTLALVALAVPVGAQMYAPHWGTPLASPPLAPSGDGTAVRLTTEMGDIVVALYTDSAPVEATYFRYLASVHFYDGTTFDRIVPGVVLQGGGPGERVTGETLYTLPGEPVVGRYGRGIVAAGLAGDPAADAARFFVVLDDAAAQGLGLGGYVIIGRVVEGMEVVDAIAAMPSAGPPDHLALEPVAIVGATEEELASPTQPSPAPSATGGPSASAAN